MKFSKIIFNIYIIIYILMFININISYAKSGTSLNKGDYIKFGSYNGEKILWRVIQDDDVKERVMLISDRVITIKAFDASGENGNNKWNECNIRDWLNSEKEELTDDDWSHGKPIYSFNGDNNYADEVGFLSNFIKDERNFIVKMNDAGEPSEDGNKVTLLTVDELSLLIGEGYDICKAKPTCKAVEESDYKTSNLDKDKYWYYWTRTLEESNTFGVKVVNSIDSVTINCAYYGHCGVRPVLWLDTSSIMLDDNLTGVTELEAYTVKSNYDSINPTGIFSPNSCELTSNNVTVNFNPDDEESGVNYYKYSVSIDDGNNYGSETTINGDASYDIVLSNSGNIKIKVIVYDKAGNYSTLYSGIYKIDKDEPSKPVVSKESGTYKEEIEVEIVKGDDNTNKIYYTLDGTIPTKDSNLYTNKIKIDGVHNEEVILKVVSYDNLSNKSSIVEKHYIFNKQLLGLFNRDKKNFKYYIGLNKIGLMKVMLVSKTGKELYFSKSDIIEIEGDKKGYFKEGIIYIDKNGNFRKYK